MRLTHLTLTIILLYHLVSVNNHIVSGLQQAFVLDGVRIQRRPTLDIWWLSLLRLLIGAAPYPLPLSPCP